jgi:protein involved in polysaccharide export with SLBB domain
VIGDVLSAGSFEIPPGKSLTAAQAIAWAGGPTKTAKMSKGMLVRYEADGRRTELPIDFAAVIKGAKPDFDIRPNDVIFVPGSQGKTLTLGLLNQVPNLLATALVF